VRGSEESVIGPYPPEDKALLVPVVCIPGTTKVDLFVVRTVPVFLKKIMTYDDGDELVKTEPHRTRKQDNHPPGTGIIDLVTSFKRKRT
jgi:hypothetical protein